MLKASDYLRRLLAGETGASINGLYDSIFSTGQLIHELFVFMQDFGKHASADLVAQHQRSIIYGIFANIHENRISCIIKVTTNSALDIGKATQLFGAENTYVVAMKFNAEPREGEVSAELTVMKEINDEVGFIYFTIPVTFNWQPQLNEQESTQNSGSTPDLT